MSKHLLACLVRRLCSPGVLAGNTVGVVVHSLWQLRALNVRHVALMGRIAKTATEADARSHANILHALASSVRDQLDPHVALEPAIQDTLWMVQDALCDVVDDLSPSESILAVESLLGLLCFGSACIRPRLLKELQDRAIQLASVVERPVDVIGLLRVVVEAFQTPYVAHTHMGSDAAMCPMDASVLSSCHQWSTTALEKVLFTVEARLNTFTKQDLITTVDTMMLRNRSGETSTWDDGGRDGQRSSRQRQVLDPCWPVLRLIVKRVECVLGQLSPSQCAAWLYRLVQLGLYRSHSCFMRLVQHLRDAEFHRRMSPSQLSTTASALAEVLSGELRAGKALSTSTAPSMLPFGMSLADLDACLCLYISLLAQLVERVEEDGRDSHTAIEGGPSYLMPLLLCLPRDALLSFHQRHSAGLSQLTGRQALQQFAQALERACSLLMRHFRVLLPRDGACVCTTILHWHVYESPPGGSCDNGSFLLPYSPLTAEEALRKRKAFCRCVLAALPTFNGIDAAQLLNEMVTTFYAEGGLPALHDGPPMMRDSDEVRTLISALHAKLQESPLDGLHTAHLVRYLSSLSKLGLRAKTEYYRVLTALKGRALSTFEQICVLGVMSRHRLHFPFFVVGVVQRLGDLHTVLHPPQKAMLVYYLGKVSQGTRFVKAPCFPPLDGSAFFHGRDEVAGLSLLDGVRAFTGLVALRQYENQTIQWLLETVLIVEDAQSPGSISGFANIRSMATISEFLAALCRFGGPDVGVRTELVLAVVTALLRGLPTSRSLFLDLSQLTWQWPLVYQYTDLALARRLDEDYNASCGDRLRAAFHSLQDLSETLVSPRISDIARSPQLRPNTFLFNQMAVAVRVKAMPSFESPEERRLVEHLDVAHMVQLLGNPRHITDAATVAVYLAPRYPEKANSMLQFVLSNCAALRISDALITLWSVNHELSHKSGALKASTIDLLQRIAVHTKSKVEAHGSRSKLSCQETRLMERVLRV